VEQPGTEPPKASNVTVGSLDGGTPVPVSGQVDASSAPELRERLRQLGEEGGQRVVLDVADLDFKDWTGLGVLVGARRRLRETGGDLVLRSPADAAVRLLEASGMSEVFSVEE